MKHVSYERGAVPMLTALLVMVVLAVVGLAVYNVTKARRSDPTMTSSTPSPASSPAVADPYKGWKTYKLDREGLSIRYPSSWTLAELPASPYRFGGFALTSANDFVITLAAGAGVPDGGFGPERVVSFTDEISAANYGKPLYVVGSYDTEADCCDLLVVNADKSLLGRYTSKITDTVPGYTCRQYELHSLRNFVGISGKYPGQPDTSAAGINKPHADPNTNTDIQDARKILASLRYD
jgi:hypothetical protein